MYYRCAERNKYGCKATLAIGKETGIVLRETGEHCHDSDLMVKKVKNIQSTAIRNAASNPTVVPRTVLGEIANNLNNDDPASISYMSKASTLKRAIQRERKKVMNIPDRPKKWEDIELPDALKVTADNKQFLILEKETCSVTKKKIIGFASPFGLELLSSSDQWIGDGTFDIAKCTLFSQVFFINAKTQTGLC